MISVTAVTIAGAAVMERVRTRLLAVPRKVAPRWATAKSATEAETLVRREIEAGLMELSRLPTLGESAAADDATNAGLEFRPGPLR